VDKRGGCPGKVLTEMSLADMDVQLPGNIEARSWNRSMLISTRGPLQTACTCRCLYSCSHCIDIMNLSYKSCSIYLILGPYFCGLALRTPRRGATDPLMFPSRSSSRPIFSSNDVPSSSLCLTCLRYLHSSLVSDASVPSRGVLCLLDFLFRPVCYWATRTQPC